MLPPRAQVAFLRDELGGFAVIGFQEVDGFLPLNEPEFGLGHITFIKADLKKKTSKMYYQLINNCL